MEKDVIEKKKNIIKLLIKVEKDYLKRKLK